MAWVEKTSVAFGGVVFVTAAVGQAVTRERSEKRPCTCNRDPMCLSSHTSSWLLELTTQGMRVAAIRSTRRAAFPNLSVSTAARLGRWVTTEIWPWEETASRCSLPTHYQCRVVWFSDVSVLLPLAVLPVPYCCCCRLLAIQILMFMFKEEYTRLARTFYS